MIHGRHLVVIGLLVCWCTVELVAQNMLLKQADRAYEKLSFADAISLYEQTLKAKNLSEVEVLQAKLRLAHSYQQTRNTQAAERIYRELLDDNHEFTGDDVKVYLYYAQTLASNGKHAESRQMWEKYGKLNQDDQRGKAFGKLYDDVGKLYKNADSYQVDYLNINTNRADFSPVRYKGGLVFCSGRGEGTGIKRVFNWDKTAFLDLYYLSDLSVVSTATGIGSGGSNTTPKNQKNTRGLGNDEYTPPTANDSPTVGVYGGNQVNAGLGYNEKPMSESDRFSKTLNTKYHEGPASFTQDGSRIVFTRNNYNNGNYRESTDKVNKLKLYTAENKNDTWANIQELPFNSDEYSCGHPCFTQDDKLLYFVSDMPGGFGGTDVYVVSYQNGSWGTPVNLGKSVNSKGNEMFPFVDENGHLYFSSDGHPGLGDLDLFFVEIVGGKPSNKVMNLGAPLNSPKDDFGIITDGLRRSGYFSSNRKRGTYDDDIYRFARKGSLYACRELSIRVIDANTKNVLDSLQMEIQTKGKLLEQKEAEANGVFKVCLDENSEYVFTLSRKNYQSSKVGYSTKGSADDMPSIIEITLARTPPPLVIQTEVVESKPSQPIVVSNDDDGKRKSKFRGRVFSEQDKQPLGGVIVTFRNECDGTLQRVVTKADGIYEFDMIGGCDYTLEAIKESYNRNVNKVKRIPKKKTPKEVSQDLGLLKEGDVIPIDNIYYEFNQYKLNAQANQELDRIVSTLKKYPNMVVEIGSHTDSRGNSDANRQLSQKRAQAVVDYLVKKGVGRNRLVPNGYGESQLVNNCTDGVACTEAEHQRNRRTTLKIIRLN